MNNVPSLRTNDPLLEKAFGIAVSDFVGNIQPWQGELNKHPTPCILAGADYDEPWTRDASLNSWYAGSLLTPAVAQNTLRVVLTKDQFGLRIGGQYWDAIIWVTAAWNHYLCTHDREFLKEAFEASSNSISYFEETEFDSRDNLFRGGACFQDGISAYPDRFTDGPTSDIPDWVDQHPEDKVAVGHGLPMKALSTNCLYYNAYQILSDMANELDIATKPEWAAKARRLKDAINQRFWDSERGMYRYLVDAGDDAGRHEGFGHAFAILFGIADDDQTRSIFSNQHSTAHGIPCVWPTYERYSNAEGTSFGRHSGTIWPQVNAAWVMAASQNGRQDIAWSELRALAWKACRDEQFFEIYHPLTGEAYGGMQEPSKGGGKPIEWEACQRQTWCATGFIQMILASLFGMRIDAPGITFSPTIPDEISEITLAGLNYREMILTIHVERGDGSPHILVNDVEQENGHIAADTAGPQVITFRLPKDKNLI